MADERLKKVFCAFVKNRHYRETFTYMIASQIIKRP